MVATLEDDLRGDLYQGMAVIYDHEESNRVYILYKANEEVLYDKEKSEGKLQDGREILGIKWLDKPADMKVVEAIAIQFFKEVVNRK